jgi:hypothetical protein
MELESIIIGLLLGLLLPYGLPKLIHWIRNLKKDRGE